MRRHFGDGAGVVAAEPSPGHQTVTRPSPGHQAVTSRHQAITRSPAVTRPSPDHRAVTSGPSEGGVSAGGDDLAQTFRPCPLRRVWRIVTLSPIFTELTTANVSSVELPVQPGPVSDCC